MPPPPRAADHQRTNVLLGSNAAWAPGTACPVFQMETFALTNWVSEQRLKHLTSIYSAAPPPAAAASLFLLVSALSSQPGSRRAPRGPGLGWSRIPGHKCQQAQLPTQQSLIKMKGV